MAIAGHGGKKVNPDAFRAQEPDEDDQDGIDLLDSIGAALGVDSRRMRAALLSIAQDQASLSEDGKATRFELTTATGTEVKQCSFSSSAAQVVQVMTADKGYYVEEIDFASDGLGSNDSATAYLSVSGHQPVAERYLIGAEGLTLKWGRPLTQTHQFSIEVPSAAVGKEVAVLFAARGIVPSKEAVSAQAKAVRSQAPEGDRKALRRSRDKNKSRIAGTVAQGLQAVSNKLGAQGASLGSGMAGAGVRSSVSPSNSQRLSAIGSFRQGLASGHKQGRNVG